MKKPPDARCGFPIKRTFSRVFQLLRAMDPLGDFNGENNLDQWGHYIQNCRSNQIEGVLASTA